MKILYRIIGRVHTALSAGVYTACLMYCHPSRVPLCRQSPERTTLTQAGDDSPCLQRNGNTAASIVHSHIANAHIHGFHIPNSEKLLTLFQECS